jgi:hypothetical protein
MAAVAAAVYSGMEQLPVQVEAVAAVLLQKGILQHQILPQAEHPILAVAVVVMEAEDILVLGVQAWLSCDIQDL